MKFIRYIEPITLVNEETGEPLKDEQGKTQEVDLRLLFLRVLLKDHKAFGENADALEARMTIIDALRQKPLVSSRGVLYYALENEAYKRALQACNAPAVPFAPQVAGQLVPLFRAIRDAKDDPEHLALTP